MPLLETILNRLQKFKSFVYGKVVWREPGQSIDVHMRARKNSQPICSGCRTPGPVYDHQRSARRFEFVPRWGIAVFFVYRMRRVDCPTCGRVVIEHVPCPLWAAEELSPSAGHATLVQNLRLRLLTVTCLKHLEAWRL